MTSPTDGTTTAYQISEFIGGLSHAIEDLTIPSQQLLLLLALYNQSSLSQSRLETYTGVSGASNSRNIAKLGQGEFGKKGHGLVESYEDPQDRRTKMVRLTPKGASLLKSLLTKR